MADDQVAARPTTGGEAELGHAARRAEHGPDPGAMPPAGPAAGLGTPYPPMPPAPPGTDTDKIDPENPHHRA